MSRASEQQSGHETSSRHRSVDDWENWEDDDMVTPIDPDEQVLIEPPASSAGPSRSTKPSNPRVSRQPSTRLKRLRSRHRQKAQNAKAGIRLITDMTTFRRQNHIANQLRTPDGRPVKFVDAAALKALEGEPTSASVGNWNWLKNRGKNPASATPQSASARSPPQDLTPGDGPIMIGISLPSEAEQSRVGTPRSAHTSPGQAVGRGQDSPTQNNVPAESSSSSRVPPEQQVSVWSPDTPDTASSLNHFRPASSVYSQATTASGLKQAAVEEVPPVPSLPSTYKKTPHQRLISLELGGANGDEEDTGTPCTLFEEDGSPSCQRQAKSKGLGLTPDSAGSRSHGWWDHVVTPFIDKRFTFSSRKTKLESPQEVAEDGQHGSPADNHMDEKKPSQALLPVSTASPPLIVRAPTPRRTPTPPSNPGGENTSESSSSRSSPAIGAAVASEKPQIVFTPEIPADTPPPYSPPKHIKNFGHPVRYRAVFPPEHPLHAQFPPSPGPGSPGLAATMTSQGATAMTDIPITPTVPRDMPEPPQVPIPNRPVGTYVPQEHSHDASGPENRVERERRRHEKEDIVARRVGNLWRGRGCIPASGCFGRAGPEGRKRRRVFLGFFGGFLALIILAIVLAVVLTRPKGSHEVPSIWVNLTDFPPMPTGVLTVVGPDNTVSNSGCTDPSTLWSCSLPKEDHESVSPYKPNQPTIILQVQWDNSTQDDWKVPNGDPPASVTRRGLGGAALAGSLVRERDAGKFNPDPSKPDFEEEWFLGETTDSIKSDEKAGEPAPFYISLLDDVDDGVEDPTLGKRQGKLGDKPLKDFLPPPDLLGDGTPKPAMMIPQPVQQPLRLYDRGLPSEHYGFYTYFKRTIYLKSVTGSSDSEEEDVPLDQDGGCTKTEANYLVTWAQTRMLVQIWTQTLESNNTKLLDRDGGKGIDGSGELIRPGTMPYPVTVTLDTHGGDPDQKFVWRWPMNDRQILDTDSPKLLANNMEFGGTVINHRGDGNKSFGGFDGGTGGCKCEWVNWV